MPRTSPEALRALILKTLGPDTEFTDGPELGHGAHPDALCFTNDDPEGFQGFSARPLWRIDIGQPFGGDDSREDALERRGDVLVYRQVLKTSEGTAYAVYGQALVCERGSKAEQAFLHGALQAALTSAAGPLRKVIASIVDRDRQLRVLPGWLRSAVRRAIDSRHDD